MAMADSNNSSNSSGSEGRHDSPRVTERVNSKSDVSPFRGLFPQKRIVVDSYTPFTRRFLDELVCGQRDARGR